MFRTCRDINRAIAPGVFWDRLALGSLNSDKNLGKVGPFRAEEGDALDPVLAPDGLVPSEPQVPG